MNNEEINILILKSLSGEIDQKGELNLKTWINSSKENLDYYESIKNIWESIIVPKPENIPDFESLWSEFEIKLNSKQPIFSSVPDKSNHILMLKSFIFNYRFSIAAAIVLILACILIYFIDSEPVSIEYFTKNAEVKTIILQDNSKVILNSASSIYYTLEGNDRLVNLNGEALFTITKNEKPFIVKTFNSKIKVTGTKFNVKARNNRTTVVVENGTVQFSSLQKSDRVVLLSKNQMSQCMHNDLPEYPSKVEAQFLNSWVYKKLVFDQLLLKEIVEDLTRYYNVEIKIINKEIEDERITGTFQNQSLDEVLSAVTKSVNCKYKKDGELIILY